VASNPAPLKLGINRINKLALGSFVVLIPAGIILAQFTQNATWDAVDFLQNLSGLYITMLYCYFLVSCKAAKAASKRILNEYKVKWEYWFLNEHNLIIFYQALTEFNECGMYKAKLDEAIFAFREVWLLMKTIVEATGIFKIIVLIFWPIINLSIGTSLSLVLAWQLIINFEMVFFTGYFVLNSLGVLQLEGTLIFANGIVLNWFAIAMICSTSHQLHKTVKLKNKNLNTKLFLSTGEKWFIGEHQCHKETAGKPKHNRSSTFSMKLSKRENVFYNFQVIRTEYLLLNPHCFSQNNIFTFQINKFLLHLIELSPPLHLDGYMTLDRGLLTTVLNITQCFRHLLSFDVQYLIAAFDVFHHQFSGFDSA